MEPPNIVMVVLDDASAHQLLTRLPLTKSRLILADCNILAFENAYASTPVCAASRASMLTGKYASGHGVRYNASEPAVPVLGGAEAFLASGAEADTLATRLSSAGYDTALVGKYLNAFDAIPAGPAPAGWAYFRGFKSQGNGYYDYTLMRETGAIESYGSAEANYSTDVFKNRCVNVIANSGEDPFFLWFAPSSPHDPSIPAPRHASIFPNQTAPRPPNYANEDDKEGKPDWIQYLDWTQAEEDADDLAYREQLRAMASLDEAVVAIIDAVKAKGKLDDTLFIFTIDNGFSHGEHFWSGKGYAYQPAVKTPIVVVGKPARVQAGDRYQLVGNIDLGATIADIANAGTEEMDGLSFKSLLLDDGPDIRDTLYLERRSLNPSGDGTPSNPMPSWKGLVASRDGTLFKYVETAVGTMRTELYDLDDDSYELVNLGSDPEYADHVAEMTLTVGELDGE